MIMQWYRRRVLAKTRQTLEAIAYTGNNWRAADRLWIDGGSEHHVAAARRAGFIEPKGRKGHVVIGPPCDMVKLTPLGVEAIGADPGDKMTLDEARQMPQRREQS